ncbi:hypothetical protein BANRA_02695 [Escherichia coli]|nr:hypothetical protein BANRA_02695 [Escherichia coli]
MIIFFYTLYVYKSLAIKLIIKLTSIFAVDTRAIHTNIFINDTLG